MNWQIIHRAHKAICSAYRTCKDFASTKIHKAFCFVCKICVDLYFTLRHYCFHILAALQCPWLPFIRKAEQQLKPHNDHLRPQYTWTERLGLGLWPSVVLFILPLTITIAIAYTIDFSFLITVDSHNSGDSIAILVGYLKTIATVLATLTGLLLTVTALTIQVKTSNLAGANFLLNAVIRKRCFLPIAAFLSGTIFTALVGVLWSDRFMPGTFNNYTYVTALLCFVSLLILVDLLRRTMQTLGTNELEQLLRDELLSSLRKSFRSKLRQALVESNFSEMLADLGFARYTATHKEEGHPTEYKLKGLGKIVAIDPAPLKHISNMLKLASLPRERNTSSIFPYSPDDNAAFVTIQPNGIITKDTQLALLTREQEQNKQITKLIRKAFIIQRHSEDKLPWQRLREVISAATERYESTTITTVADTLTDTFDDYLDAQAEVAGQGKLLLEDFIGNIVYDFKPPHPFNLRLSDLAVEAGRIRSQDCLGELLTCIYRLAQKSFEKHDEKYFRDWIFQFYWAYHSFGPHTKGSDFNIGSDITRRIHWLNHMLRMDIKPDEKSAEQVKKVTPYAISYLSLCLNMLKTAAERCDQSTFDSVCEHVMQFLKYELEHTKKHLCIYYASDRKVHAQTISPTDDEKELLLAYDELLDYKNLVYVIAGAWLMHKVKANELQGEKVDPFVKQLIAKAPNFRSLLDLYAMPGMADMTTNRDNPLSYDNWDRAYSLYPEARWGTDFQRWIKPFYQFLLLKKAIEPGGAGVKLHNIRQTQNASHESLKKFLDEIDNASYSLTSEYQNLLDNQKLDMAKKRINKITSSYSNNSGTLS